MGPQIDALRVTIGGELEYYSGAGFGWSGTGLFADLTTDPLSPAVNHLSFKGTGYGTNEQVFEITLNGESFIGSDAVLNVAPNYITLIGGNSDYVVDNVVVRVAEVPEPSTIALLIGGCLAAMACIGRKRKA